MSKGGSKVLTSVIAFLLGFIFALLVEVGAIVGVYFYVTKTDLDTIFNALGIPNKDGDGNYIYINTDNTNGGAQNLEELFVLLKGYLYSDGASAMDYPVLGQSLNDINNLLPVVQSLLSEKLYPMVSKYIDVDWEKFESVTISEMPQFLSETLMDVRPAGLLGALEMDGLVGDGANVVVKALLAGAEFSYTYLDDGRRFPLYYDSYVWNDRLEKFYRTSVGTDNNDVFPDELSADLLYETKIKNEEGKPIYRLYFMPCKTYEGGRIADPVLNEDGDTIYAADTEFIAVKYSEEDDKYIVDLDNYSDYLYRSEYGSVPMSRTGNFYYTNDGTELQIRPVTLRSFSDQDEAMQPLYCVSVTELMGKNSDSTVVKSMFGNASVGELMDGKIDIDEAVNDLELGKVISVDPEQTVMAYIGYRLNNVKNVISQGKDWQYEGYAEVDGVLTKCYINAEYKDTQRAITKVWYYATDDDGVEIEKELVGTKVKEVSEVAKDLEITAVMSVKTTDAILAYLGYGVTSIKEEAGEDYTHVAKYKTESGKEVDCFIATGDGGVITSVWYMEDGEKILVKGTPVSKLSERVNGISQDLTLGDVMTVDENDKILWALKDSKICEVGTQVKSLKISDVLEEEDIDKSAILRQLRNKTIDELSTAIDDISIQSIYSKDIYGLESENEDPKTVTEYKENILYFIKDEDGAFTYVNNELSNDGDDSNDGLVGVLTQEEYNAGVANGITYYSYGEAQKMWRLILFKDGREKVYTLNNFNNMVNSCTVNIYNAKLYTLQEAGIITVEKEKLDKELVWYSKKEDGTYEKHEGERLGDITFAQLIEIVLNMEFPELPAQP